MNKTILIIGIVILFLLGGIYYMLSKDYHHVKGRFTEISDIQSGVNIRIDDTWYFFYNNHEFDFSHLELNRTYNFYYQNVHVSYDTHTNEYHLREVRDEWGTQPIGFKLP